MIPPMSLSRPFCFFSAAFLASACLAMAQTPSVATDNGASQTAAQAPSPGVVPRLIRYAGALKSLDGTSPSSPLTVKFSLYASQSDNTPLWVEEQRVQVDAEGRYTVLLGATNPEGLPLDLFTSTRARWLGVLPDLPGATEQARVLLVGVPYALKAADADTLGGKPASAYMTVATEGEAANSASGTGASAKTSSTHNSANATAATVGGGGTTNFVPLWTSSTTLGNSVLFQNAGQVAIGTSTPTATLDVRNTIPSGTVYALKGISSSTSGVGVLGAASAGSGTTIGLLGYASSTSGTGLQGNATSTTGASSGVKGFAASNDGTGVLGEATANNGITHGIAGVSVSPMGIGVIGHATATGNGVVNTGVQGIADGDKGIGIAGSNLWDGVGVQGTSGGVGVLGVYGNFASVGGGVCGVTAGAGQSCFGVNSAGVIGIAGNSADSGVIALGGGNSVAPALVATNSDGAALVATNNPQSAYPTAIFQTQNGSSSTIILQTMSIGSSGSPTCTINAAADLACSGTKSAVVPVDSGVRKVALYAMEAPENWFEDFGSGKLSGGSAVIRLEAIYSQTVNTQMEYHVFLTPKGDCKGLYVSNETPASFEVHELGGGSSDVAFDYRIVARRKGYEQVRLADKTAIMASKLPPVESRVKTVAAKKK